MRKVLILAALASVAALISVGSASAAHWESVTVIAGNPSCEGGQKIEPVTSGTYGPISLVVSGSSFSWSASVLVTSVIVKGGPNAHLYTYTAPGVSSDSGLTAPINPSNGRSYGLSHLCFFFDDKKPPPPPPPKK